MADEIAEIAEDLANWREYCRCTNDHQEDIRCDGSRCIGQQREIERTLRALSLSDDTSDNRARE